MKRGIEKRLGMCTRSQFRCFRAARNSLYPRREFSGASAGILWKFGGRGPISCTFAGGPIRKYSLVLIQPAQRPNNVADVRAYAELRHPPDIDRDLHRGNLITEARGS